jgi:uncharacterized membrane protein YvbJ
MISCQVCAHDNTLGTVFCRSCGTRLVVDYQSIEQSVHKTKVADRDHALLQSGRSALLLCSFALVCALIARYVVVPPMPSIVPPPVPVLDIFAPSAAPATTR